MTVLGQLGHSLGHSQSLLICHPSMLLPQQCCYEPNEPDVPGPAQGESHLLELDVTVFVFRPGDQHWVSLPTIKQERKLRKTGIIQWEPWNEDLVSMKGV